MSIYHLCLQNIATNVFIENSFFYPYMKKFILILCSLTLLFACRKESISESDQLGKEITIELGSTSNISLNDASSSDQLHITVDNVIDARCPKNVSCVWAGKAEVSLTLASEDNKGVNMNLCLGQCQNAAFKEYDTDTVTIGSAKYKVKLLQVNPYPDEKNTTKNKSVQLRVETI